MNGLCGQQWFDSLAYCGIRGAYCFIKPCWTLFECWGSPWHGHGPRCSLVRYPQASLFEALGRVDRPRVGLEGIGWRHARTHLQQPTIRCTAPAVGGRAPAFGGRSRVWHSDRCLIKQAIVITLPDFFPNMRTDYTAAVLYRFWCKCKNGPWFNFLSNCSQRRVFQQQLVCSGLCVSTCHRVQVRSAFRSVSESEKCKRSSSVVEDRSKGQAAVGLAGLPIATLHSELCKIDQIGFTLI
jgi:hypothetical protein